MTIKPLFSRSDNVVLRSTREMGRIDNEPILDGGEYWYRVRFVKRVENIVEEALDPLDDIDDSLENLAIHGRWGRIQAFRCALAVERIKHANRSTVYSFKAQRILFEPYQYKPLLKILDSPDRRLVIADEVGLGKTIEGGLVLTELEARRALDSILIACPSRLRDKWREELNRKFDQDFDIYDKRGLLEYIERFRQNPRRGQFRGIVSMQTLRSEEIRELLTGEVGHLDMVIVDEAHHARNPQTKTSDMLRDLCSIGDCVLLLTATPLHLGSRDLFTLLHALRPSEFRDPDVFDRQLRHHRGVIEASSLVRSQCPSSLPVAREKLEALFVLGVSPDRQDPLAVQVIRDMVESPPQDRRAWIELERRVQDLHPLASIVTRTRKRDVQEHAAVRKAAVFRCRWTAAEHQAYQKLVAGAVKDGWIGEGLTFGQIQRARQAASCLPAAVQAQLSSRAQHANPDELSDIPEDDTPGGASSVPQTPSGVAAPNVDSKYAKLREILGHVWSDDPSAKVLIFTFFVGTAKYLIDRLAADGVTALRISGDIVSTPRQPDKDERGKRMRSFREDPTIKVMVSTEVGSEGLDFQFCHHLVNYDLPWNPMVVEQRIGRIDRYGQKSDKVYIHNLVVEGTVEDRILLRLYERIGIFRESIGDLETILGETMSDLQRAYITGKLTPEEADLRVEQAARAINQRRVYLDELQKSAGELFGHEEFIRDEMNRVGRLGRYISGASMLAVIESFLESHHPDIRLWEEEPGIFGLRLTDNLRSDIQDASRGGQIWVDCRQDGRLLITSEGDVAFRRPEVELINVNHPLLRAAVRAIQDQLESPLARVGQASLTLESHDDPELQPGVYFLLVFAHAVEGIRSRRVLETIAWSNARKWLLDGESSERLLHLALERGHEWDSGDSPPSMPEEVWREMLTEARSRNRELREREVRENEALYARRKAVLEAEYEHDRDIKTARLRTAESRGRERVLPALRGQVQKAEAEYHAKLEALDKTRVASARLSDPVAACVLNVRR